MRRGRTILFLFAIAWLAPGRLHAQIAPLVNIQHVASDQTIQPGLPPQVLLGESFKFLIEVSPHPSTAGYGPFVEVYFPYEGADCTNPASAQERCDGIFFVSAKAVFAVTQLPLSPCPAGPSPFVFGTSCSATPPQCLGTTAQPPTGCFFGLAPPATCLLDNPAGFQKVVLELPVGSFVPGQAPFLIEVTARVDSYADPGVPLTIKARGGFRFGTSALGGQPTADASCPMENGSTVPMVALVRKVYGGPEDETATGSNFTRSYEIEVDIADGQTLAPLKIVDCLPDNMELGSGSFVPPGCTGFTSPSSACPNNGVEVLCPSVTGTSAAPDLTAAFAFYIPEIDIDGQPVLGISCTALSVDDVKLVADWDPLDPRDSPDTLVIDFKPDDHILSDRCAAIQKEATLVSDLGAPGPTPGDTVRYTLHFQISDFKTAGNLVINDYLSDGQSYIPGSAQIQIGDKFGTVGGPLTPSDVTSLPLLGTHVCASGATMENPMRVGFLVSQRLASLDPGQPRHAQGILTGGFAGTPNGPAAEGVLVFDARIDDTFQRQDSSLEPFVDKDDVLLNCVEIYADTLANANAPAVPSLTPTGTASDTSEQKVTIVHGLLRKTVHAINGNTNVPPVVQVNPGDNVTFRIHYTIPSGDAEDFFYEDYLPLPVFDASTLTYQGCFPPLPASQRVRVSSPLCNGPVLFTKPAVPPNSFRLDFGDLNDPGNAPVDADVYLNVKVGAQPFADGLVLSNHVLQGEKNTFGVEVIETEIAPIVLREPKLRIRKGVVASSKPTAVYANPAPTIGPVPAGVNFNPVNAPGFSGVLTSTNVGTALNSDIFQVDACDIVKFAIVVENLGSSTKGAFDVRISDALPPCLTAPKNLRVVNGLGQPFTCNGGGSCNTPAFFTPAGITLDDLPNQGALKPYSATSGTNLAVITFNAQIPCNAVATGCCNNQVKIDRYAGVEGGPNHTAANFSMSFPDTQQPFSDGARACVQPALAKSILATSEAGTGVTAGITQLTIGEIVRYRLRVTVPEGVSPNMVIADQLPAGLEWLPGTCTFTKNDNSVTHASPVFQINGGSLSLNLGNVNNPPNDPAAEVFTIDCNALVLNQAANVIGGTKPNSFTVTLKPRGKPAVVFTSNVVVVRIAEPQGGLVKEELPVCIPGGARYRLSYVNTGTSPAYDVRLHDLLPAGVTVAGPVVPNLTNCTFVSTGPSVVDLTCPVVPPGGSLIVPIEVQGISPCKSYLNSARLQYTSLPGPKGTFPNPTGSMTPGPTGQPRGERPYGFSASLTTLHCADLAISQVSATSNGLHAGSIITYDVTVTNVGTTPSLPPTMVKNDLPAQFTTFSTGGGNGWSCTGGNGTATCTLNTPIPAGASSTFTMKFLVVQEPPGIFVNSMVVTGCDDTNLENNRTGGLP